MLHNFGIVHDIMFEHDTPNAHIIYMVGPKSKVKVKFSHTRYRALGPELIPVYRQSARR